MVEMGWPHNEYSLLDLSEARLQSLLADNGRHAKLATDYRGIVFAWSKIQKSGYQPRHARTEGDGR